MKSIVTSAVFAAALFTGAGAWAQQLGPNADGPVDITADELEADNKACLSVWKGKAEALQGQARLRADVLKATFASKAGAGGGMGTGACGDLLKIEAQGSVYYVASKGQQVRGDQGAYDVSADTVTVSGDVVAVQGQNVLRGNRMVFNTKTGQGRMVGGAGERPRGVFYPSKKTQGANP